MRNGAILRRLATAGLPWIGCLAIGFLIGRATNRTTESSADTLSARLEGAGKKESRNDPQSVRATSDSTRYLTTERKATADAVSARAITEPPGLRRLIAFQELIQKIDITNWRDFHYTLWNARAGNLISSDEIIWVMQRIGEVAGRDAMEAFKPADPIADYGIAYSGSAMKGWAIADKPAAEAYINSLLPGKFRQGMINGFVLGVGPTDVNACRRLLATLAINEQQQTLNEALRSQDGLHFEPLARAWLDNLESENPDAIKGGSSVFNTLVNQQLTLKWADPTGEKFFAWVSGFAGKPYITSSAVSEAAFLKAQRFPEEALAWLESFTQAKPTLGKAAFVNVMNGFIARDGAGAMKWLDANRTSVYYGEGVLGLLNARGAQMDDATVDAWLNTITDDTARTIVARAVIARRQKRDAAQQPAETLVR